MQKVFSTLSANRIGFVLILFGFLAGCQTTNEKTLPSWVSTPALDNEHFYAVGEGLNQNEAQQNAQEALESQLLAGVNNDAKTINVSDQDFRDLYVKKANEADFKDIDLPRVTISEQAHIEKSHFAQVKLKKSDLSTYLITELEGLNRRLSNSLRTGKNANNAFEYWWVLQSQTDLVKKLTNDWLIATSTTNNKNGELIVESQQLLTRYDNAMGRVKKTLKLRVDDNTPIKGLTKFANEQLTAENVKVVYPGRKSRHNEIEFNTQVKRVKLEGDYHSKVTLVVLLKKASGVILASRELTESAVSDSSFKDAEKKANAQLLNALRESNVTVLFSKRQS